MTTAFGTALDARRQRIIISYSQVNWVKWLCLSLQAVCTLLAIAMIHSDNRLATAITMGLFGIGVAAAFLLILAHERPFTGDLNCDPLASSAHSPRQWSQQTQLMSASFGQTTGLRFSR